MRKFLGWAYSCGNVGVADGDFDDVWGGGNSLLREGGVWDGG